MSRPVSIVSFSLMLLFSTSAIAAPVAIVEELNAPSAGLEIMDFVSEGQTIKLGASEKLVLGYMQSCVRETITGGTITIATKQSTVNGGQLVREDVPCANRKADLDGQVAGKSGAMAFRGSRSDVGLSTPDYVIMGTSPVFVFDSPAASITITRIDRKGETYQFPVEGKFIDTSKQRLQLQRGATYKAEISEDVFKTFKVDTRASHRPDAIVNRMIRLP